MMKVTKPKAKEAELRKEGFNDFILVERMYMDGETVYKGEMPEKTNYFSIMAARKL